MTDIISKLRDRIPMNPEAEWAPIETALLLEAIEEMERLQKLLGPRPIPFCGTVS